MTNDIGRFKSTEGLFNLEVWGMDNPPLQKLIQTAVQASPMDTRREMWRCGCTFYDVHRERYLLTFASMFTSNIAS